MAYYKVYHSPEDPSTQIVGSKIHTLNGFKTLKPYYLGTWTLRVGYYKGYYEGFRGAFELRGTRGRVRAVYGSGKRFSPQALFSGFWV